jgi:hypothetical protein
VAVCSGLDTSRSADEEISNARIMAASLNMLEALRQIEELDVPGATMLLRSEALLMLIEQLQRVAKTARAEALTGDVCPF